MVRTPLCSAILLLCSSVLVAKDDGAPTFVSARKAGIDYQLQGEYAGTLGDGQHKWGAQIIATGKGTFQAIGFAGGLPGDGWTGDQGQKLTGKLADGTVSMEAENFSIKVDGKKLDVIGRSGVVGTLKKVVRKSKTLGKKPPKGARVLFDGSSTDAWKDAKLVQKKLLGATNCYTTDKFGDHTLHIEFRTPFMPQSTGQARGNSGVYVQSRYEVQVLDSFGLAGKDNECGGIYKVSKPKVNMCYPPLTWQTYDIDFVAARYDDAGKKTANARITVKHNGVTIHDKLTLPQHTPGRSKEGPGPAPLFLQNHSNPVVFRNIWVVEK